MPKIVHARIHPVFLPGASEHQRVKIKKKHWYTEKIWSLWIVYR